MIIYGTRSKVKPLGQVNMACQRCGRVGFHSFARRKMYFTLFWIPLFPFSTKTFGRCNMCGYQQQYDTKESDQMLAAAQQQSQAQQAAIAPHGYPGQGQYPRQ